MDDALAWGMQALRTVAVARLKETHIARVGAAGKRPATNRAMALGTFYVPDRKVLPSGGKGAVSFCMDVCANHLAGCYLSFAFHCIAHTKRSYKGHR